MGVRSMATIRDLMAERNLTLMQLAVRARVSVSTLQRIINGATDPWLKTKQDIADALDVAVEDVTWPKSQARKSEKDASND